MRTIPLLISGYFPLSCIKSKDAIVCLPVSFPNNQMYTQSKIGRQISATISPIKSLLSKVYPRIAITSVATMLPASKITPTSAPIRFSLSFISEFPRFFVFWLLIWHKHNISFSKCKNKSVTCQKKAFGIYLPREKTN